MKHCDTCNKPLIIGKNASNDRNERCSLPNSSKLSECQRKENIRTSKINKIKRIEEAEKRKEEHIDIDTSQMALRTCLRCDEREDGSIPTFLSKSPHNRICEPCSDKPEGLPVKYFKGINSTSHNLGKNRYIDGVF